MGKSKKNAQKEGKKKKKQNVQRDFPSHFYNFPFIHSTNKK